MRKDVTINRQQSEYLNNACTLGYGKFKAQFGDVVLFREGERVRVGRVAGKIKRAPREADGTDLRGHLVVVALGQNLSHVMERWVSPADVIECFNPDPAKFGNRDMIKLLAFFFGPEFKTKSVEELRQFAWGHVALY